jgi:uncharacterized protein (TIGR00369 family)
VPLVAQRPVLNLAGTLDAFLGIEYELAEPEQLIATLGLREEFLGTYGDFRTGVAAAISESICSFGTALTVVPKGDLPLGSRNDTDVVARPSGDRLRAEATVVSVADDRWLWDCILTTEDGARIAVSRVTVAVRPAKPPQPLTT